MPREQWPSLSLMFFWPRGLYCICRACIRHPLYYGCIRTQQCRYRILAHRNGHSHTFAIRHLFRMWVPEAPPAAADGGEGEGRAGEKGTSCARANKAATDSADTRADNSAKGTRADNRGTSSANVTGTRTLTLSKDSNRFSFLIT